MVGQTGTAVPTSTSCTVPLWTASALPTTAKVDVSYGYQLQATGSPQYALVGGMFPGVVLDAYSGVLSGTPWALGSWTFFVTATNSCGFVIGSFTVTVVP
jgi:hypothetical protein